MKLYVSLAALVVAANAGRIDKAQANAEKFVEENNPLSDAQQDKLEGLAREQLSKFMAGVQSAGDKYGVKFNVDEVSKKLQNDYEGPASSAADNAKKTAEKRINAQVKQFQNNKKVQNQIKNVQNRANTMTFGGALKSMTSEINKQIANAGLDSKIAQSLQALVKQGNSEAKNAMKKNKIRGQANIKNRVQKEFEARRPAINKAGAEQKAMLQEQLDEAIANL